MSSIASDMKKQLHMTISEMASVPSLFAVHPDKDFIRNTPMNFANTVTAILQMGGQSLGKELYNFMKPSGRTITTSAFVQQRVKLLPETFDYAFHDFNDRTMREYDTQRYNGYKVYAVDGSDVIFATNPLSEAYMKTQKYNMYHMNALYDLMNHTYRDLIIEPKPAHSEPRSCWRMAERSLRGEKCIIIGDRGYGGANLFEHLNRTTCSRNSVLCQQHRNLILRSHLSSVAGRLMLIKRYSQQVKLSGLLPSRNVVSIRRR